MAARPSTKRDAHQQPVRGLISDDGLLRLQGTQCRWPTGRGGWRRQLGLSPTCCSGPGASAGRDPRDAGGSEGFEWRFNITLGKPKVGHIDLLLFSRQLHTLLKAGVPILRALAGLQESAINPAMKE